MKNRYKLKEGLQDLSLDDVIIPKNESPPEPVIEPTNEMQERFMKNCLEMGILEEIND